MRTTPTPEMIERLPKWAKEHLADAFRQRDNAVGKLREFLDNSTKTNIYMKCHTLEIGDRAYLQSDEVTFVLAPREEISIRLEDGRLHCMGCGSVRTQLVVKPRVTNVLDMSLE